MGAGVAQLALLWPPLARLNRRLVYSGFTAGQR
jgi:hypothetical protein